MAREGAANAEIDILQIGPEVFVQKSDGVEQRLAENGGGHGSHADLARLVPDGRILFALSAAPGAGSTGNFVEGAVDEGVVGGVEDFAGGELGSVGLVEQLLQPVWFERNIVVENRNPV